MYEQSDAVELCTGFPLVWSPIYLHICVSIYLYLKAGVENSGMISSLIVNQKVTTKLGMMDGLCPSL